MNWGFTILLVIIAGDVAIASANDGKPRKDHNFELTLITWIGKLILILWAMHWWI